MRFIKWIMIFILTVGVVFIASLPAFFLQDAPIVDSDAPPESKDVIAARQLLHGVRRAANNDSEGSEPLQTSVADINSAIRLGSRMIDGFRARIRAEEDTVFGELSFPIKWLNASKWVNISGQVPAFHEEISIENLMVGSTRVSGPLAIALLRVAGNIGVGDQFGDKVFDAVTGMTVVGDELNFAITLDEIGKNGVMRGAVRQMRGSEMPTQDRIEHYHVMVRAAMEDGHLAETGSFLPYLRFILAAALTSSTAETAANEYTAAIMGLAKVCGAQDFQMIVGRLAFDKTAPAQDWPTSCGDITFNGRIDSRRHFVTAAALQAASNSGVAISIGEFKELYDISASGGFDFTDMAANLSGIRLSNELMTMPLEGWSAFLTQLQAENDVIVPFDDIPPIMSEDLFKARYSDVNSAAYQAEIRNIETRIDRLGPYRNN